MTRSKRLQKLHEDIRYFQKQKAAGIPQRVLLDGWILDILTQELEDILNKRDIHIHITT